MITFEKKSKYGSFNDTLGMSIDTGDKWLNKKLNANICYGKGGGGGGSQPQDVPKTLQPYVQDVLGKAKGLYGSYQPFQAYPGERIVSFSPQEQAAMGGIEGLVGRGISATPGLTAASTYYAPALGLLGAGAAQQAGATGLLGQISPTLGAAGQQIGQAGATIGTAARDIGQFRRGISGAQQTLAGVSPELAAYRARLAGAEQALGATAPTLGQFESQLQQAAQTYGGAQQQLGRAEEAARAGAGRAEIGDLDVARYMDPYQQQVIDIEKRQARQDALEAAQAIGAKAAGMGGFGGSRQAILEAQQASDLGTRLADIQARGSQAAYDRALQTAAQQQQLQYGEDVARLQRQSGLGQALAGLSGAQAGIGQQQAGLGISGYGGLAQAGRDYAGQLAGLGGQYGQIGQQIGSLAGQQGQLAGQFGTVAGQVGQLGGQQLGVGQALGQLAGQYGTGAGAMGQQAAGLAGLSQAFGGLGQQALGQGYREQGYLSGVGEQQRGMEQQRADLAYQQFVEEREFPSTQLQKYSSLIQGFPFQFSQAPQQPSAFQTAAGGIATLGGLGRGLGFFNKGGDIGKGGLAGIVNKQEGGSISDLIKQIEQEKDEEKKSELINEVLIRTGSTNNKEPRLAKTIKEKFLPYSESDSPLSGLAKAYGRGVIETISLPSTLGYIGAGAAEGLTTPKNILALQDQKRKLTPLSDEAFDTASALEAAIGKGTITPAQAQTVNLRDITSDDLQAAQNIASTPAVTPTDATTTPAASAAETMEEKLKRLMAGSAFDREAREKQLKSDQGFALANMGLGILSADPSRGALAAIGQGAQQGMPQLMQARRDLEGLDKEEREAELSAFTKELGLSKIIKDLGSSDLVPLFPGIDAYVEELAGTERLGDLAGAQRNKIIADAQEVASARAVAGGYSPDSAMAEKYLREELTRQADAFKDLAFPQGVSGRPNAGRKAGDVTLSQLQLPAGTPKE